MTKTNAMRILASMKIPYTTAEYEVDPEDLSGVHAAELMGLAPERVYKTLVARSEKGEIVVLCIPVARELDLKKCAVAASVKRLELTAVKELLSLTGYIRGGCSPIGMKKKYRTFLQREAGEQREIFVSGGMRGVQICLAPSDLVRATNAQYGDLCR
ncbi:MAG: Cys-tRNA(Pro) deacylase [Ruminococcaceae bacterium]|nr:Cys-tRNA(Pro) deacylase [Oscillospiraceae bacterium]